MSDIDFQLGKDLFTTRLELSAEVLARLVQHGWIDDDLGALAVKLADQLLAAVGYQTHLAIVKDFYEKKAELAEGMVLANLLGKTGTS